MNEGIVVDFVLVTREVEGKWNNAQEVKEKRLEMIFTVDPPLLTTIVDVRVDLLQLITENPYLWRDQSIIPNFL